MMLYSANHQKENLTYYAHKLRNMQLFGEAAGKSEFERDIQTVYDCAKIVHTNILKSRENPWLFDGSLNDETVPAVLYNLIKWIVGGSHSEMPFEFGSHRTTVLHRLCVNIAETIMIKTLQ